RPSWSSADSPPARQPILGRRPSSSSDAERACPASSREISRSVALHIARCGRMAKGPTSPRATRLGRGTWMCDGSSGSMPTVAAEFAVLVNQTFSSIMLGDLLVMGSLARAGRLRYYESELPPLSLQL